MHLSFNFHLLILALLSLTISAVGSPINIWPKPRIFSWTSPQAIPISGVFQIDCPPHEQLTSAAARYLWRILTERHKPLVNPAVNLTASNPLLHLSITVSDLTATLSNGVNESYTLSTPSDNSTVAYLTAETPWGAMRGLESFSQLVWGNPGYVAAGVWISDWPLFAHRGIMLDTSRNYFEVDDLLRTIKAMSDNKLNVFHWHITDSHSFPLVLPSEMDLAAKGSYGPEMVYTPEDVKKVVDFGMDHGVRVMPEIDMPGHTGSFANAYPEIVTCANEFWWPSGSSWSDRLAAEPGTGHLNPVNPKTYEVLKNMIKDVTSMFPEEFYHAGADEIIPRCWESDPTVKSYMTQNNVTLSQLLETFVNTTYPYISSANKTVVYWEDVLLDSEISVDPSFIPSSNTILQTWNNGPDNTKRIVENGYRVIVSSSNFYYLDCGHGDFVGNNSEYNQPPDFNQTNGGSWCGPFKSWQLIYNYDINYGLTDLESKLVLGGEVALWTEQADPTVLDARLWPRSSAFAEAMWSGNRDENGSKRFAEATDRLNEWRYRMVKRGVNAEPIQPLWCIRNPGMCNTVQGLAA